jgi:hypothetical protein
MYTSYLNSSYSCFSCNFLFYFPYVRIREELHSSRARAGNIISTRTLVIPQQEEVLFPTVTQLVNPQPQWYLNHFEKLKCRYLTLLLTGLARCSFLGSPMFLCHTWLKLILLLFLTEPTLLKLILLHCNFFAETGLFQLDVSATISRRTIFVKTDIARS